VGPCGTTDPNGQVFKLRHSSQIPGNIEEMAQKGFQKQKHPRKRLCFWRLVEVSISKVFPA